MIERYGAHWNDNANPVEVERHCIRAGGYFIQDGRKCGAGLFTHYKNLQFLLWPEDYHNRWTDWMLRLLLSERIVVFMGSKDTGKSRCVSKWALCDYWTFPNNTLTLVTSTTTRGLELRCWGDIKSLWTRATNRWPHLEGNPVDAKYGIFTDDIGTHGKARDMRKGLIVIPTMNSEEAYDGSALMEFAGIKQERRRLIGEEMSHISCFVEGSRIDTPSGTMPIEWLEPGSWIRNCLGSSLVLATSVKFSCRLVKITMDDGRQIQCTPDHPFFTQKGWIKACELSEEHYILSAYEAMRIMRSDVRAVRSGGAMRGMREEGEGRDVRVLRQIHRPNQPPIKTAFLRSVLCSEMESCASGNEGGPLRARSNEEKDSGQNQMASGQSGAFGCNGETDARFNSGTGSTEEIQTEKYPEGNWSQTEGSGGKRHRPNQSRMAANANVSGRDLELRHQDREMEWERLSADLQSGFRLSDFEDRYRSGRFFSQQLAQPQREGPQKGQFPCGAWVDSVEVLKSGHPGFPDSSENPGRCRVFNLQVQGHPSYSVNGLLVHNCEYLKTLYAMNAGDFKGAFNGNPIADNGKALDRIAEPEVGWGSLGEIKKSCQWRNKYGGVTLNLVGTDSPNLHPQTTNFFPGMFTQETIDRVAKLPGAKDSAEWWSQIMGVRKSGVISDRVLTVEMCEINGAFKDVIWNKAPELKIVGVDAGFGGDDCVETYIECGEEVGGIQVIKFCEQKVIPVLLSSTVTAEDQIATAVKADCANWGVPDSNVFIEAGMRATLAISFSRIMSATINAINFGGPATNRPVSNELFVFDEKTQERRLKTCYEHYSKFITELAFAVRNLVESGQARTFIRSAAEEFQKRKADFIYGDRYELESKIEYKRRNSGKSPNDSDSIMIACEGARRLGFVIQRLADPDLDIAEKEHDWLQTEIDAQRKLERKRELTYK